MKIEDTAGNITYWNPNCDCGLTGGCNKCRPFTESIQTKESKLQEIRRRSIKRYSEAWRELADR